MTADNLKSKCLAASYTFCSKLIWIDMPTPRASDYKFVITGFGDPLNLLRTYIESVTIAEDLASAHTCKCVLKHLHSRIISMIRDMFECPAETVDFLKMKLFYFKGCSICII